MRLVQISARRFVSILLGRLRRAGIHLELFLLVHEAGHVLKTPSIDSQFRLVSLAPDAIDDLVRLEPGYDSDGLQQWFQEGKLCLGAWAGPKLVGKTWCNLDEIHFPPARRRLEQDEAYMFGTYVDPAYRGHDLAVLLRAACYTALKELGRTRLYSTTDYFNRGARRYKEKVDVIDEQLHLHVDLFGRWSGTMKLRPYMRQALDVMRRISSGTSPPDRNETTPGRAASGS